MQHALRPLSVVREKQQTLRVRVEAAHRIETLAGTDVVDDGPPAALVLGSRHDPYRFVHQHVAVGRRRGDEVAIDFNVRIFEDTCAERRDQVAVHAHATFRDHLLSRAA